MKITRMLLLLLMFLLMTAAAWGVSNMTGGFNKTGMALISDTDTRLDCNNIEMFVYNDGNFAYDNANVLGKTDGLYFPRGTKKTVIYAAGLWFGAMVTDTTKVGGQNQIEDEIRIGMAEFSSEFVPGPMKNGTFQPDRAEFKVYKIKRGDTDANPDYRNWPQKSQGAPVDEEGKPALLGDQMLWSVFNDADPGNHINEAGGTRPLGVEVQNTTFGFARSGALGNTAFMKFKIINKGNKILKDCYVSIWADADNGDASDDLVGCDTIRSLGYCYNSGADPIYGNAAPAVGFDFFQGPIVQTDSTDTAYVSGEPRPGFKNLPMASFNKYINGTEPNSAFETYNYMKGLDKKGPPLINPKTDEVTRYFVSGNPVTGEGWIDSDPADRRLMLNSGPFTMEPGDTQEVVTAVMVGQGSDPLNSIDVLKQIDGQVQTVFDLNFDIPPPPPGPTIWTRGGDKEVDLIWSADPVGDVQISDTLNQEFHFEGFNVYQGLTAVGPWKKFATYDLVTDDYEVALIYGDVPDPSAGGTQRVIVQTGSNSGLAFHTRLNTSQIDGTALKNNQPYFFAVTSYSYDYRNISEFSDPKGNLLGHLTESLESPAIAYEVRPFTHSGAYVEEAVHNLTGRSDGRVQIDYIHPDQVLDAQYRVTFNDDLTWNLKNLTSGAILLENQQNQSGDYVYDIVEGMMVQAIGPIPNFKSILPDSGLVESLAFTEGYMAGGRNAVNNVDFRDYKLVFLADDTAKVWVQIDSIVQVPETDPVELDTFGLFRYLDDQGDTIWAYFRSSSREEDGKVSVPFAIYDLGDDYEHPDQPVRIWTVLYDFYVDGNFYIDDYVVFLDKNTVGCKYTEDFYSNPLHDGDAEYWGFNEDDPISRKDWDYRLGFNPGTSWNAGDSLVFVSFKGNVPADTFDFTTYSLTSRDGEFIPHALDEIKTVPNPYYSYYQEEVDQFDRKMKWINLPAVKMTIRIFNLAGDLIRTLERTENLSNPEFFWDLKTDRGLWVASGIYVWLIEAEGLGAKYGKMAIFAEVEQLNTF